MIATRSLEELLNDNSYGELDFTLKGLLKGHIGMLIAAPNSGKSHLALCIGIEHASSSVLVGLSERKKPTKTLILSSEDNANVLKLRMQEKLQNFSSAIKRELKENLHFLTDLPPLIIPPESNETIKQQHDLFLSQLTDKMKEFDLVIIDTVTESIGECDEVRHDRIIKNTFQNLAKRAECSILLVHHVNKEEIRGTQKITMASGAGLTSIMRLTKCLFALRVKEGKRSICFLKNNYLKDYETKEFPIEILGSLTINPDVYKPKLKAVRKISKSSLESEPESIVLKASIDSDAAIKDKKSLRDVL